jgi:hypothetical protein
MNPYMRAIWGVLFTLMATVGVLGWCDYVVTPADVQRTVNDACVEDEPCWDCQTMGNRLCGGA